MFVRADTHTLPTVFNILLHEVPVLAAHNFCRVYNTLFKFGSFTWPFVCCSCGHWTLRIVGHGIEGYLTPPLFFVAQGTP